MTAGQSLHMAEVTAGKVPQIRLLVLPSHM